MRKLAFINISKTTYVKSGFLLGLYQMVLHKYFWLSPAYLSVCETAKTWSHKNRLHVEIIYMSLFIKLMGMIPLLTCTFVSEVKSDRHVSEPWVGPAA